MWVSGELNALAVLPQERKLCPLDRKLGAVSIPNDTMVVWSCHVWLQMHMYSLYFLVLLWKKCHFQGKFLIQLRVTDEVIWSW